MDPKTENKIKICIVNPFGYGLYNKNCKVTYGGGSVQLFLLSKEFAKNPIFKVSVLTGDYNLKFKKRIEIYDDIKLHICIPISFMTEFKFALNIFFKLIRINPDIVIQRAAGSRTGIIALYCKIFKKKFIYSVAHEIDINGIACKGFSGKLYKFGLINSSYIIAQHNDQLRFYNEWRKKIFQNIKVIKSGYQIDPVNIESKSEILWVARAEKWKRAELFLKLAESFKNERFLMILNRGTDDKYWKYIYNEAKHRNNVEFLEFIPFEKIDEYFKHSKVFVNTSTFEGFPNTFIQAAKNKTPILSVNVNPDDFLNKFKCGFYCKNSLNELINKLRLLLENTELYNEYTNNCYEYAKRNHDIVKITDEWINVIKSIYNPQNK